MIFDLEEPRLPGLSTALEKYLKILAGFGQVMPGMAIALSQSRDSETDLKANTIDFEARAFKAHSKAHPVADS